MNTAVLFLVFNRPDTTRRVFEAIRNARPKRLYVAADGPRADRPGEEERCAEVRRIATAVDWPCEVETLFRDNNLGCKHGVSSGISWFFEHEEEGIILEDDVLPVPSFFPYCEELLARYRDDARVSAISGSNRLGPGRHVSDSYFFSRYVPIWGWASWRRAWCRYDLTMESWTHPSTPTKLNTILGGRERAVNHWISIFNRTFYGEIDTWDYQWTYTSWMNDMVAIIPAHNLTENLGFGTGATHTTGTMPASLARNRPIDLTFPLRHPQQKIEPIMDHLIEQKAIGLTRIRALKDWIRSIPLAQAILYRVKRAG